jgi:hypothetical protein
MALKAASLNISLLKMLKVIHGAIKSIRRDVSSPDVPEVKIAKSTLGLKA